jgi:protoporphyrinogen IX oxidase
MTEPVPASPARRAFTALAVTALVALGLTIGLGDAAYLWIKALHVVAVIAWMAGQLYLPRLFVYHSEAPLGSPQSETFKVMEGRLLRLIMNPAMVLAWVLGLWLAWKGGHLMAPWFHAKLVLVLVMSGVHGHYAKAVRRFGEDRNDKSARYWRIWNEVPAVLMIAIVILVIVKPF